MKTLIEQLDHGLVDLAWSLWNELGVAGTNRQHENCLIALEELIILTAVIAESDPCLRDEALDWCSRYHHFVSISRLRTLVKKYGEPVYVPFSAFAITLNSIAQSKWPIFSDVKPLSIKPSGKSKSPHCEASALLGLRLRALFGVGARADLLTFFLTQKKSVFTASDTIEIGYSKRSLADLLDNFVESGFFVTSVVRNQRKYEFVKCEQLKALVGNIPKVAPPWSRILEVLIFLRTNLQQSERHSITTKVVLIRSVLTLLENSLRAINLTAPLLQPDPNQYWESFTKWLLENVNALAQSHFRGNFKVENNFERTISALMQELYSVDDCLDGLEFIISCSKQDLVKHSVVFKEAYQLTLSYLNELREALKKLLRFPFHQLMDFTLSDIPYQFSRNYLSSFLTVTQELPSLNLITNPRLALNQYKIIQVDINKLHEFVFEFKERLKNVYFFQTDVNLLTLSTKLYKRHPVLNLFSS